MVTTQFYPTVDADIGYMNGVYNAIFEGYNYVNNGEYYDVLGRYIWRRSFLRFDFGSIPASAIISSAVFKAYYYDHSRGGTDETVCKLAHVADIGASVDSGDWGNAVINDYGTFVVPSLFLDPYGWKSKDVTSSLSSPFGFVSYRLKGLPEDDDANYWNYYFWASEKGSLIPYVEVVYTVPSEPKFFGDGLVSILS